MSDEKRKPQAETCGAGDAEAATPLTLPLDFTMTEPECQILTIAPALRVRDAIIALERRLAEARIAFESEISEILKSGGGR